MAGHTLGSESACLFGGIEELGSAATFPCLDSCFSSVQVCIAAQEQTRC